MYNNLIIKRYNEYYLIEKSDRTNYYCIINMKTKKNLFTSSVDKSIKINIDSGFYIPIKYKSGHIFCKDCGKPWVNK